MNLLKRRVFPKITKFCLLFDFSFLIEDLCLIHGFDFMQSDLIPDFGIASRLNHTMNFNFVTQFIVRFNMASIPNLKHMNNSSCTFGPF